jgi:hypothetical protein
MISATRESICNIAIGKIRAKAIASYDDDTLEGRECRRFYPEVVRAMLEGPEDWVFSTQRVTLAGKTNDRPQEWGYAFQLPSNLAAPIRVLPDLNALGLGLPVALPGDPYAEVWSSQYADYSLHYEINGDTIYVSSDVAILEYTIDDIAGVMIPALVGQALGIELGAHLAVPVKGDSAREKDLMAQAETAWERAIAENRNRQPTRFPNYESETLAARHGYGG